MTEDRGNRSMAGMPSLPTVQDALRFGQGLGLDRLDSAVLLGHVLGRSRAWLIAHDDRPLTLDEAAAWRVAAARRAGGEPVAYIVGRKEFHGLDLRVTREVLVPRPETELLVAMAVEAIDIVLRSRNRVRVLDLGTGSGAIALACKNARRNAEVFASDVSDAALDVARANAIELGLDLELRLGSWWEPWRGERFDLVLCNPPYVAEGDPHLATLRHEPRSALIGGSDRLDGVGGCRSRRLGASRTRRSSLARARIRPGRSSRRTAARSPGLRASAHATTSPGRPRCTGGGAGACDPARLRRRHRHRQTPHSRGKRGRWLDRGGCATNITPNFRRGRSMNLRLQSAGSATRLSSLRGGCRDEVAFPYRPCHRPDWPFDRCPRE